MINAKSGIIKTFTISLIPLIIYFVIDEFFGLYWGVAAALIAGIAETAFYRIKDKTWDKTVIASTALIIVMGILSVIFNSPVFVMFKPVIFESFFGFALIFIYITKSDFVFNMASRHTGMEIQQEQKVRMRGMTLRMGVTMLIHAVLIAVAIFKYGKKEWLFVKGVLFYVMFALLLAFEFIYAKYFKTTRYSAQEIYYDANNELYYILDTGLENELLDHGKNINQENE